MANKRISELTSITGANLADADLLVVVDVSDTTMASSGTNKKVTLDEFAQDSTFSSRYVAKADEEYRWLGIGDLVPAFGSPSVINPNLNTGNAPMWGLDAASAEGVAGSIILPDYWTNFKIELYWCNASSSSGDVRWLVIGGFGGSGEDPDAGPGEAIGGFRTLAAPTTGRLIEISQFPASTANANQAGKIFTLLAYRDAAVAADTLTNDAGVYGVLLTRTS